MTLAKGAEVLRETNGFLPELESLRGWAILLVVAFHYYGLLLPAGADPFRAHTTTTDPFWLQVAASGNTGVVLFFVLSGFLLSRPFIQALQGGRSVGVRRFYIARALRILPLYYAFVGLAWVATGQSDAAIRALLFMPVGADMAPFSVPWWTLATEVQFYLLLPWLMLVLRFRIGCYIAGAGVLAWLSVLAYCFHTPSWLNNLNNWHLQASLFGRGPAFLVGIGCAWFYGSARYPWLFVSQTRVWIGLLLLLAGFYLLLRWYSMTGQLPALQAMPMFHNLEALFWGGILLCCLSLRGRGKWLLINPMVSHFGALSYSIYLVHVPVQVYVYFWIKNHPDHCLSSFGSPGLIAGSFALAWIISLLTYHGLEKPCLGLKARIPTFSSRRETAPPLET
jgi:peptidoglycan/LPS O-acetylase OafA/YrhL